METFAALSRSEIQPEDFEIHTFYFFLYLRGVSSNASVFQLWKIFSHELVASYDLITLNHLQLLLVGMLTEKCQEIESVTCSVMTFDVT